MNIDTVVHHILETNSDEQVCKMLDEEIVNWVDDGWEDDDDGYASEQDWYANHVGNEAEDAVIDYMISEWVQKENAGAQLSTDEYLTLFSAIKTGYSCLDYPEFNYALQRQQEQDDLFNKMQELRK